MALKFKMNGPMQSVNKSLNGRTGTTSQSNFSKASLTGSNRPAYSTEKKNHLRERAGQRKYSQRESELTETFSKMPQPLSANNSQSYRNLEGMKNSSSAPGKPSMSAEERRTRKIEGPNFSKIDNLSTGSHKSANYSSPSKGPLKPNLRAGRVVTEGKEAGSILKVHETRKLAKRMFPEDSTNDFANKMAPVESASSRTFNPKKEYSDKERYAYASKKSANKVRGTQRAEDITAVSKPIPPTTSKTNNGPTTSTSSATPETKKSTRAEELEKTRALKWPEGSAEADGMLDQIKKVSGDMYDNFTTGVETKYGGNYAKALGGAALKGGVWGGAIGGVTSSAQGGDFWEGAKQGAFTGALGGAAIRTAKLGTNADSIRDIYGNGKAIWNQYSKPVKALETNARNLSIMNK